MANSYLEKKIRNISLIEILILVLLIIVSLLVGKYWTGDALRNLLRRTFYYIVLGRINPKKIIKYNFKDEEEKKE